MDSLVFPLIILLALVAYVIARPLIRREHDSIDGTRLEELEAAKEAKYREIRDARLDLEMGKLSEQDHRALDRELRAEAVAILVEIDELESASR